MIDFSTCTSAFASGETYSCNCIYGQLYLFFMSFFIFIKFFKILFLFIFINMCWILWLNVILRWISCVVHIRSSPVYIICIVLGRFSLFCVLSLTIIKAFIFKGRQQHHIITAPSDINTQSEGINEFSHLSIIIFLWITDVVVVQPSLLVWMCPVCFLWMISDLVQEHSSSSLNGCCATICKLLNANWCLFPSTCCSHLNIQRVQQ